jgi:hypothetical protein
MAFDTFSPTATPFLQAPVFVTPVPSPSDVLVNLRVELRLDLFPQQIGWSLFCDGDVALAVRAPGTYTIENQTETEEFSVRDGAACEFFIEDTNGDGINNVLGGGYFLFVDDVLAVYGEPDLRNGASVPFCATNPLVDNPECPVPVRIEISVIWKPETVAWGLSCDGVEIANFPEGTFDDSYYSDVGRAFNIKDEAQCNFNLEQIGDFYYAGTSYSIYVADILVCDEFLSASRDDFTFVVSKSQSTPSPTPLYYPAPEPDPVGQSILIVAIVAGGVVVTFACFFHINYQQNQQNEERANAAITNFALGNRPAGSANNDANLVQALEVSRTDRRKFIEQALITRRVLSKSERSVEFSGRSAAAAVLDQEEEPSERSTRQRLKRNFLIRAVATSLRSVTTDHENPSSCDVCLTEYEIGEEVCRSPNEDCHHVFHKECIVDWLMTRPTCPCCRRYYLAGGEQSA